MANDLALQLDGTEEYVTMGDVLGLSRFTVSIWFKSTGTGVTCSTGSGGITVVPLVGKGRGEDDEDTHNCNYLLGILDGSNVLAADFEEGPDGADPGENHPVYGITAIEEGVWYNAVLSYDGDTWRIYLDGQLEAEAYIGQPLASDSAQYFAIGSAQNTEGTAAGFFNGLVDSVSIWDNALSEADILSLMETPATGAESGLLAAWNFEDSGTTVASATGSYDGTLVGGDADNFVSSDFDSADMDLPPLQPGFSVQGTGAICLTWTSRSSGNYVVERAVSTDEWETLATVLADTGTYTDYNADPATQYWYRLRVEDSDAASAPVLCMNVDEQGRRVVSFTHGYNGYFGSVDLEILQATGVGPDSSYHPDVMYADNNDDTDEDQILFRFEDIIGDEGWQFPSGAALADAELNLYTGAGGAKTSGTIDLYRMLTGWDAGSTWNSLSDGVSADDSDAESTTEYSFTSQSASSWRSYDVTNSVSDYLSGDDNYGWVVMNEGSDGYGVYSSLAEDIGYRPTLNLYYDQGSSSSALHFDGSSTYVGFEDILKESEVTVCLWFRKDGDGVTTTTGSGGVTAVPLVSKGRGQNDNQYYNCDYFLGIDANGHLAVDFEESPDGVLTGLNHPLAGTIPVVDDEWYFAAATYDGETWKLYVNGVLDSELYVGQPLASESVQYFAIGTAMNSSGTASGYFAGDMDDVSIWNRALTASEINVLMRSYPVADEDGLEAYWPLESSDGTAIADANGNYNGTFTGSSEDYVTDVVDRTSLVAAPSDLKWTSLKSLGIQLDWTDNSDAESGYVVERSDDGISWTEIATLDADTTTYTDDTASRGSCYWYIVRPSGSYAYCVPVYANCGTSTGLYMSTFIQNVDDYDGSLSIEIRSSSDPGADATYRTSTLFADNNSDTDEDQILIRFSDIVGEDGLQVPSGAVVQSATLRIYSGESNAGTTAGISLYRMLVDWDADSTWNSMDDGVSTDGGDFGSDADDTLSGATNYTWSEYDVTGTVQDYVDGGNNYGWAIVIDSSDGYGIQGCDAIEAVERPQLVVTYSYDTVPAKPTDLVATAISSTQIDLSWTDNADGETSYQVERSGSKDGDWAVLASGLEADTAYYSDTTVSDDTKYYYRVSAINDQGGSTSEIASARTGDLTGGLTFDGSSSYVAMGNVLSESELTICLWFKRTGDGVTSSTGVGGITAVPLVSKGRGENDDDTYNCNYFFGIDGSDTTLAADFEEGPDGSDPGENHPTYGATIINNDVWYHAAVTYDGDTWCLYVDAELDGTTYVGEPMASDSIHPFAIGSALNSSSTAAGFFEGIICQVGVWNRALTQEEIAAVMGASPDSVADGLEAYWPLDETEGLVATDEAGDYDGTLTDMEESAWTSFEINNTGTDEAPSDAYACGADSGDIEVFWTDNADDETGFVVERRAGDDGDWTEIASLAADTTSYDDTDSSLEQGEDYYYRVRLSDGSVYSDLACANIGSETGQKLAKFRYGVNTYADTVDIALRSSSGVGADGTWNESTIYADNNSDTDEDQVLIKFEDLFGTGALQVPADVTISSATLRLYVGDGNNPTGDTIDLYHMLASWDEDSTWNSMDDGISTDDVEAASTADCTIAGFGDSDAWCEWDVTDSVKAWQAGDYSNNGWTILNEGSDGFGFVCSETSTVIERPQLVIEYAEGEIPDAPENVRAEPLSYSSVQVTWDAAENASYYEIQSSSSLEDADWTTLDTSTDTSYTLTGLEADSASYYRVAAYNDYGGAIGGVAYARTDTGAYGYRECIFCNDVNAYDGSSNVGIIQADEDTSNTDTVEWVDYDDEDTERQVLLKFGDVFGNDDGQVPLGSSIKSATLRIYVGSVSNVQTKGDVCFHQMLVDWDESSTWSSDAWGGDGVDHDDVDAMEESVLERSFYDQSEYYDLDVTDTVANWSAGDANYGWLLRTWSSDGFGFYGNNTTETVQRPTLFVDYDTDSENVAPEMSDDNSPDNDATDVSEPADIDFQVDDDNGDDVAVTLYGRKLSDSDPDFSVILLPDTQYYSAEKNDGTNDIYLSQTQWIIDNREDLNIAFVLHMGDMVDDGDIMDDDDASSSEWEWENAAEAMYLLDDPDTTGLEEGIPYAAAIGNHDQEPNGDPDGTSTYYNKYFGIDHYENKSYYGGHYESDSNDNYYQLYSVGSMDFLSITLEYRTSADADLLEWVSDLVAAYPERHVIFTTHYMLNTGNPATWSTFGEAIYEAVKGYSNVDLFLGGHIHGQGRRTDTYNGHTTYALLQDYQSYEQGGLGYLRILTFSPKHNKIYVQTYSPWIDRYKTDDDSEFELDYEIGADVPDFTKLAAGTVSAGDRFDYSWDELSPDTTYEWYVTMDDGRKTTTSDDSAFTTADSTYSDWKSSEFSDSDTLTDRDDDYDNDGYTNYYEFVFNGNPKSGGDTNMPTLTLGEGKSVITYQRIADAGLTWTYLVSTDMVNWSEASLDDLETTETVTDNGDGTETVVLNVTNRTTALFWRISAK